MKPDTAPHSRQRGVALISVLLIFALVVILASDIASRQYLDTRSTANLLGMRQAEYYALGAEEWARQMLYRDRADNTRDTLLESWAEEQRFEPENGEMVVVIRDAQGLFNLNNLVDDNGLVNAPQLAIFQRLLADLKLPQAYAERVVDWLDRDNRSASGGDEQGHEDHRPANMRIAHPSELRAMGMADADYRALRPLICTLPASTPYNVNTLEGALVKALAGGVGASGMARIAAKQRAGGYTSLGEFEADLGRSVPAGLLSLDTRFFQVQVNARFGDYLTLMHSLILRDRTGDQTQMRIVRREYGIE